MKDVIKFIGVMFEVILMICAIVLIPVMAVVSLYDYIRYGVKMPNVIKDSIDVIRTLYGYIKEIVAL